MAVRYSDPRRIGVAVDLSADVSIYPVVHYSLWVGPLENEKSPEDTYEVSPIMGEDW